MICPYNGFKEMDCEDCAAYQIFDKPGSITYIDTIQACAIARNGGAIPNRMLMYIPEQSYHVGIEATQSRWISVKERLPDVCDLVLVIANGKPRENIILTNAVLIASFWGDEGWIADAFDGWDKLNVSHWMPLPEPPMEDNDD